MDNNMETRWMRLEKYKEFLKELYKKTKQSKARDGKS